MAEDAGSLKEENARLQAQIRRLEARLKNAKLPRDERSVDEVTETARELPNRTMDELTRLTRGVVGAYIEQLKQSAELLEEFATELGERNRPTERGSTQPVAARLPGDIFAGVVRALDRSLEFPSRTIQSFVDNYKAPVRKRGDETAGDAGDATGTSSSV